MIFNKKNTKKKNAIIVGCGRFGSRIAGDLSLEEWDVTVIDNDRNAFRLLPSFFGGSTILSYATDLEKLEEAGIKHPIKLEYYKQINEDVIMKVTENR